VTSDGTLTIDLADQHRVLQQSDVLTFGRAADLVIDEENPYLHRIVGRFFWHGGSWWLENLGSFIELEVLPEGGSPLRLPASQPESTPVVHALAPPGFSVRFESNGSTYVLTGVVAQTTASLSATTNGSAAPEGTAVMPGLPSEFAPPPEAPPNGNMAPIGEPPANFAPAAPFSDMPSDEGFAPPPQPGDQGFAAPPQPGDQRFAPPPQPGGGGSASFEGLVAEFGSLPGLGSDAAAPSRPGLSEEPQPDLSVSQSSAGFDGSPFVLAPEEREVLLALVDASSRDAGYGSVPYLPSDAELAQRMGRPVAQVTRRLAYLCNRLTRSGVPRLQGGDRRSELVRYALDTGLVAANDMR
jgi:hypothetical protein